MTVSSSLTILALSYPFLTTCLEPILRAFGMHVSPEGLRSQRFSQSTVCRQRLHGSCAGSSRFFLGHAGVSPAQVLSLGP
jgi:hypothetical protein